MEFKNDLEMGHKYAEMLKLMQKTAEFEEIRLYQQCVFYEYDVGACEEYCKHPKILRAKDFMAKEECYKCSHFTVRKERPK